MSIALRNLVSAALLLAAARVANAAAEWQFAVDLPGTRIHASMWIPPACERIRGILLAQQVILEDHVMESPIIRAAGERECLAFVLMSHGAFGEFDYDPAAPPEKRDDLAMQKALDLLAVDSGYAEIASAPLLPIGHSGAAIAAWNIGYWNPGRTIAIIGLHAAAIHPPYWAPKATIDGVPFLGISGQYESWGNPLVPLDMHWRWLRGTVLEMRASQIRPLMSILIDPGTGHFSFSEPMARYVAMFIEAAAEARIPRESPAGGLVKLREIPLASGWLTDETPLAVGANEHPAAAYADYTGDRSLAFWHLTKELALANENYRREERGKQLQMVTCAQNGTPLKPEWLIPVPFEPHPDGQTVTVEGAFLSETPSNAAGGGVTLGHAGTPVEMSLIGGWAGGNLQTGPDRFRIAPGHMGLNDTLIVLAYHSGDDRYGYTEAACQVRFPKVEDTGAEQTLTFAPIEDRVAGPALVPLSARASSGLPVEFFVVRGPATLDGSTLRLAVPPAHAHFPMRVTVGAFQRGFPRRWRSAAPVEHTFLLTQPEGIRQ